MSISSFRNFLNPPPVPDTPTVTLTLGASVRYSSATASLIGNTVLDPSSLTGPLNCSASNSLVGASEPPQATSVSKAKKGIRYRISFSFKVFDELLSSNFIKVRLRTN